MKGYFQLRTTLEDGIFCVELDNFVGIDSIDGGEGSRDSEDVEGIECGGSLWDSAASLSDLRCSILGVVELETDRTEWVGGPRIVKI